MAKHRCEHCDKEFKTEDALEMHKNSKHANSSVKKNAKISNSNKKIKGWIIFIVISIIIVAFLWWTFGVVSTSDESCQSAPVRTLNLQAYGGVAYHWHPTLEIIIDEIPQTIPANIGISPGTLLAIHTHDATGELHVEPPCQRDMFLGDFFEVWGRELNSNQIFDKTTENGELTMTVNGQPNNEFENLVLKDGDRIVIEYISFN